MNDAQRPHVVIVGGGFGGLEVARGLARAPVRLTLVDARNHHLFQPLLYQVATAGLNPSDIAAPIRGILRKQRNLEVLLARAERVERATRTLHLDAGTLRYDFLVLATGTTHAYFGQDAWAEHAPGLKTVEDALEIRRRILLAFESAEHETDSARRQAWLTFCVVGGGPTGVELAGALAELSRHTLAGDFRRIDPRQARVILCEGGSRVLAGFPPALSAKAQRQLERLGAEVRLNARVTHIDAEGLELGDERLPAKTVLWAAGIAGSPLARSLEVPLDRVGKVLVAPDLSIPGDARVLVIGDLAAVQNEDGSWVPGMAPAAMQEGRHAAESIARRLRGEEPRPFRYWNKGILATVGRAAAVADIGRFRLAGWPAWMAWLLIHIVFLIGFRNRALVLFQWAWAYLTYERGARLITGDLPGGIGKVAEEEAVSAATAE